MKITTYTVWSGHAPIVKNTQGNLEVSMFTMTQGATPHHFKSFTEALRAMHESVFNVRLYEHTIEV